MGESICKLIMSLQVEEGVGEYVLWPLAIPSMSSISNSAFFGANSVMY
jgi:hypothetical protein